MAWNETACTHMAQGDQKGKEQASGMENLPLVENLTVSGNPTAMEIFQGLKLFERPHEQITSPSLCRGRQPPNHKIHHLLPICLCSFTPACCANISHSYRAWWHITACPKPPAWTTWMGTQCGCSTDRIPPASELWIWHKWSNWTLSEYFPIFIRLNHTTFQKLREKLIGFKSPSSPQPSQPRWTWWMVSSLRSCFYIMLVKQAVMGGSANCAACYDPCPVPHTRTCTGKQVPALSNYLGASLGFGVGEGWANDLCRSHRIWFHALIKGLAFLRVCITWVLHGICTSQGRFW